MAERAPPPDECAQCGARLPRQARACPECGADERTGWREVSLYDGLDLPAEAWREEEEASGAEGEAGRPRGRINGLAWYWWAAALLVLAASLVALLARR